MTFRTDVFLHDLLGFDFADAALVTLWISMTAMLLGLALGLGLAIMQDARLRLLRSLAWTYLWLFRGTPVLLQIIFAFNVLPGFGIILSGPVCAILALGLHEAAYVAEIFRAGLAGVDSGQKDAARALGMSEWRAMRLVILPQAVRLVIPPIGNQFIGILKLSALISVIGVRELLLAAEQSASATFRYLEALSAAGVYYLAFTTVLMVLQRWLERRFGQPGRLAMRLTADG
ncbi:MAG TPA: amino acid ABC transporter permease [Rhodopila sp.]|uniref:amino acid ABC transporter permease n=1 Tax=Rhodopila sp. TaxID=2480087 RepID=UPI002C98C868|nr:amino acid ABC transporter permease [Rhodopila sp.]HVY16380.1 amino acid ABC transporter permease [Rhodopila sp.]